MKPFKYLVLLALAASLAGCTNPFKKAPSEEVAEDVWEEEARPADETMKQSKPAADAAEITYHDRLRKADLSEVRSGLELYYGDNLVYPAVGSFELLRPFLAPEYVKEFPVDPAGESYHYFVSTDQKSFLLGVWLEGSSGYYLVYSSGSDYTEDMPAGIKGVSPYQYATNE